MRTSDHRPETTVSNPADRRVDALVASMTLADKVGQMTQVELGSITPTQAAAAGIGSVLCGGGGNPGDGSASAWRETVTEFVEQSGSSRTGVPVLYGADAVHGHNNVRGATIFPHNIAMGAAGDPDLMRSVSRAAARETRATGVRWSFAPCLAVPRDPRWGRTYEGFSQDPALVAELGRAAVEGWQGTDLARDGVLACPKHFLGDGATTWGSAGTHRHPWLDWWDGWGPEWAIDQGDIDVDETELRRVDLPPFAAAVDAGALSVMACYASWRGERLHGNHHLLTGVLKSELGFPGFVVSDWMAVDQIDPDYAVAVATAVNAGIDMVMVPFDHERFIATTTSLVDDGRIRPARIDDAVRRILRTKAALGLLEPEPSADADPPLAVVGCADHRDLARSAVQRSVVVLRDDGALPVARGVDILAAGSAMDDVGICCGGWTISWMGSTGRPTPGTTILDGLRRIAGGDRVHYDAEASFGDRRATVGIVTVHESPYAEGLGDRAELSLDDQQVAVVRRLRAHVDRLVLLVVSGRPLWIEPATALADAVVACWLPGTEADGVADVLLGAAPATGRLPVEWPAAPSPAPRRTDAGADHRWPVGTGSNLTIHEHGRNH